MGRWSFADLEFSSACYGRVLDSLTFDLRVDENDSFLMGKLDFKVFVPAIILYRNSQVCFHNPMTKATDESLVHTKTERQFIPHLLLLQGAQHYLRAAKEKSGGWYYDWLGAIVFSALSIEAIGNSYGKVLIPNWKEVIADLVQKKVGASPIRKLQLVAKRCGINPDFQRHPWLTARKLTQFRDLVAHAKREHLKKEENCTLSDYGQISRVKLETEFEKMITEDFASKSCDAVEQIIGALNKTLGPSELHELAFNGQVSHARVIA